MQKQLAQWDQRNTKYAIFVLIALYLLLFLPFWQPVLLGFLFASACAPLVNRLRDVMHARRSRVAYFTVGFGLFLMIGFVALIGLQIYAQLLELFQNKETVGGMTGKITEVRNQFMTWIGQQPYLSSFNLQEKLDQAVTGLTNSISRVVLIIAQGFVSAAPEILLALFIFFTAFGAFLVIQPRIWENASRALGLGSSGKQHFQRFEKICTLALGSVLLTALLQSMLVVVGSLIAGFGSPFMIFTLAFFLAMIPVVGAGAVPIGLTLIALVQGDTKGVVIMLITSVIVGVSDNVLRAWLFSRAAKSNPAISIITLLGGIALFGFPGLFIAPVIEQLVMTYAFSDEGEPAPGETAAADEPVHPDQLVSQPSGAREKLKPRHV